MTDGPFRPGSSWDDAEPEDPTDNWTDWEDQAEPDPVVVVEPPARSRRWRRVDRPPVPVAAPQSAAGGPVASAEPYDDEYDDELPPPAGRGRGCLAMLVVLAIIVAVLGGAVTWVRRQIDPPGPPGAVVAVAVPKGTSGSSLGKLLNAKGVIGNDLLWKVWSQSKGVSRFQAGRYNFRVHSSFEEAVATLKKGPAIPQQQNLTIPEGLRLSQVAERVGKLPDRTAEKFLAAASSGSVRARLQPSGVSNLEGLLFPDTYSIDLNDDETAILTRMVERFDEVAADVALDEAQTKVGVSPYEALIVASLVEREAKFDDERPKIARVIYNRLKADMALQIDATLIYANGGNRVLFDDLKVDGPYNTYTRKGLPPTPIAMPGKASLEAALNPVEGDWLYYVVTETDGRSSFATTFAEHKRNIALAKKRGLR